MKAIILAAGKGTRLGVKTKDLPKCLLSLDTTSTLGFILDTLHISPITEVIIVVGYKRDIIMNLYGKQYKSLSIKYVYNKRYETTNSTYSLFLAKHFFKDGIIVINADTIFSSHIIHMLLEHTSDIVMAIDNILPSVLTDDAMKVTIKDNKVISANKKILLQDVDGIAIGVYKFTGKGITYLNEELSWLCRTKDVNHLFTYAVEKIMTKHSVYPLYLNGLLWIEVDTLEDFFFAKKLLPFIRFEEQFTLKDTWFGVKSVYWQKFKKEVLYKEELSERQ